MAETPNSVSVVPGEETSQAQEILHLQCRFYEQKFPEIDELVMVNVRSIAEMGAYVSLLEYNNIEGMILLSELSRRRIRSINKLIRVGKNEVVMVLRVDKEKGYIDLSKRRVSPEDIAKCEERYNKAKTVHGVLRQVAQENHLEIEDLYSKVAWPLYKKFKIETVNDDEKKIDYVHCYDVFKMGITDDSVFEDLDTTPEILAALKAQIRRRLTPQPIKIRADIEVTCFTYEGIEAIRSALQAAQDIGTEDVPVKVKLIAPPMYVMTTSTLDKQKGIQKLQEAIEAVREHITAKKGTMSVKMEPKVVSVNEEKEFLQMIEKLENENRLVDGDAPED
ncbi:Eukaryotic translation initiation factor 2 subunit alpha [Phytophthora fragariae]|uniref:Eukaryotic translation initiation factor 2 subunit alpha n=3 Tax=Phytophthora TaxID=4783 RepID=A0A6A3F0P4_9STRA|nr:Eukaryotic translation initiation factor 2 subunit alpha [Phytophthora fragariae]KAE9047147.1 Eukaryotic translation initiation factor 2 subunit alpha [Phytophthora rubi]KAE8937851.1 Eukaryotic translation initiation factor 2 subunit alpha [Phytophthora fragariae]KAE9009776.1 Eukaryotic translation initiation factor 2 subunit alpha [Phytophthora fragariae]KAE9051840.1 Eukaryotic translation initiation factor 2 subunit alpha [Phytophthora rubi]